MQVWSSQPQLHPHHGHQYVDNDQHDAGGNHGNEYHNQHYHDQQLPASEHLPPQIHPPPDHLGQQNVVFDRRPHLTEPRGETEGQVSEHNPYGADKNYWLKQGLRHVFYRDNYPQKEELEQPRGDYYAAPYHSTPYAQAPPPPPPGHPDYFPPTATEQAYYTSPPIGGAATDPGQDNNGGYGQVTYDPVVSHDAAAAAPPPHSPRKADFSEDYKVQYKRGRRSEEPSRDRASGQSYSKEFEHEREKSSDMETKAKSRRLDDQQEMDFHQQGKLK
jgi:hypothetical protein